MAPRRPGNMRISLVNSSRSISPRRSSSTTRPNVCSLKGASGRRWSSTLLPSCSPTNISSSPGENRLTINSRNSRKGRLSFASMESETTPTGRVFHHGWTRADALIRTSRAPPADLNICAREGSRRSPKWCAAAQRYACRMEPDPGGPLCRMCSRPRYAHTARREGDGLDPLAAAVKRGFCGYGDSRVRRRTCTTIAVMLSFEPAAKAASTRRSAAASTGPACKSAAIASGSSTPLRPSLHRR